MNKKLLFISSLAVSLVFLVFVSRPDDKLHIVACDVGQGDAFLLIHKKTQVLVDGGPNSRVLDCLEKYVPFWDRTLELVVMTHPEKDHYGGLNAVFERYQVQAILASSLESGSNEYQVLKKMVGDQGIQIIRPLSGREVRIGLMSLDILWPTKEFLSKSNISLESNVLGISTSKENPNDFSVVFELKYKDFKALFTGDIGPKIEDKILALGEVGKAELIKVPHHGSKNGLSKDFLQAVRPEIAFIGVGKNPWGHPHQEVLDMLSELGVKIYRMDLDSYVELVTDGKAWKIIN